MADSDDHALMMAVRAGDNAALTVLFARHHVALFNYFRKLGSGRSDSEDLVQETFMRMLKYAGSYTPGHHFVGWMYGIARNEANSAWQARRRTSLHDEEREHVAPPGSEPEQAMAMDDAERCLQCALQRLPRDKRELVVLSRVKELNVADLATLFDCSVGALKVRLHRSLAELREYFDEARGETRDSMSRPVSPATPLSPRVMPK